MVHNQQFGLIFLRDTNLWFIAPKRSLKYYLEMLSLCIFRLKFRWSARQPSLALCLSRTNSNENKNLLSCETSLPLSWCLLGSIWTIFAFNSIIRIKISLDILVLLVIRDLFDNNIAAMRFLEKVFLVWSWNLLKKFFACWWKIN